MNRVKPNFDHGDVRCPSALVPPQTAFDPCAQECAARQTAAIILEIENDLLARIAKANEHLERAWILMSARMELIAFSHETLASSRALLDSVSSDKLPRTVRNLAKPFSP
jgi:hypothetical protein